MPTAIGHSENAYNYFVSGDDGSVVPVLKSTVPCDPTWAMLASAAGMDYLNVGTPSTTMTALGEPAVTITETAVVATDATPSTEQVTLSPADETP